MFRLAMLAQHDRVKYIRCNIAILSPGCHSERKFFWNKKIEVEESRGAKYIHEYKKVYKVIVYKIQYKTTQETLA